MCMHCGLRTGEKPLLELVIKDVYLHNFCISKCLPTNATCTDIFTLHNETRKTISAYRGKTIEEMWNV
jgi:hypothetical protein